MTTPHDIKLWPLNQLLEWIDKSDSKYLNISASELIVLLALTKFCNDKWICWPSISRISNITLKDKKHIEDVLKRLVLKNILLKKERFKNNGDRDSNEYTVLITNLWKVGANSPLPFYKNITKGRGKSTPTVGANIPLPRGKSTPVTIESTTNVTTKSFYNAEAQKQDNSKKHDWAAMKNEKAHIDEHERQKKELSEIAKSELGKRFNLKNIGKKYEQ
jgi:hypothetical protein